MAVLVAIIILLLLTVVRLSMQLPACDSEVYCSGDLLNDVQRARVFEDSKEFVDLPMKTSPAMIINAYSSWSDRSQAGLTQFISHWFLEAGSDLDQWNPLDWTEQPSFLSDIVSTELRQWALNLHQRWRQFGRKVGNDVILNPDRHSLLAVPHPFIVPGGRFREFYYWDSYWIIQGLLISNMTDTARGMIENIAYLVNQYGLVPNGGRVYYTRRSQPPLLAQMVWLYYTATGNTSFVRQLLPSLDREYQFWMTNRSVSVSFNGSSNGSLLNQYQASITTPRPESYREDSMLASQASNDAQNNLFINLASGAESGWDFSSRWLSSASELSSIQTTNILPVDLNALLCQNERTLEQLHRLDGNDSSADVYMTAWRNRAVLFDRIFWNEENSLWQDWDLVTKDYRSGYYGSTLVPLMWGCDSDNITRQTMVMERLKSLGLLDYQGGIPTSLNKSSSQQWDYPNVWAPLHWFLVAGWKNSSSAELRSVARTVAEKWISSVYIGWQTFNHTMFEKYDCRSVGDPGGGGEYTVQSGFGWTNGVALHYLQLYPDLQPPSPSTGLAWITVIVIFILALIVVLLCTTLCTWVYRTGERQYWARVRHEQLIHSTSSSTPTSPTVYENQAAMPEDRYLLTLPSLSSSSSSNSPAVADHNKAAANSVNNVLKTSINDSSMIIGNPLAGDDDDADSTATDDYIETSAVQSETADKEMHSTVAGTDHETESSNQTRTVDV